MKPGLSDILGGGAFTLLTEVAPHLENAPYARGHTGTIGLMAIFAAQEAEWTVDVLHREIDGFRTILTDAGALALPVEARTVIEAALAAPAPSTHHVSTLTNAAAALKAAAISLHEALEADPSPAAAALEARLLSHLADIAAARMLHIPPM
jgi:hypothetical protein